MIYPAESSTPHQNKWVLLFHGRRSRFFICHSGLYKAFLLENTDCYFFLFKGNFFWSKQSSRLLTVNQSAVSVSVATGTYKRQETRCKSHSALAFDVNTQNMLCLSVLLKMSVYYPTLILKEGQNNPYNDFSA